MAHFALINSDNIVENVIVAEQDFIDSGALQSEYPHSFREITKGGRGWTWDEAKSTFIAPQPYPSWTLNSDNEWEAPVAEPAAEEGKVHIWNETDQQWDTTDYPSE